MKFKIIIELEYEPEVAKAYVYSDTPVSTQLRDDLEQAIWQAIDDGVHCPFGLVPDVPDQMSMEIVKDCRVTVKEEK